MGPVFGETEITITGLRFKGGKVQVKFGTTEKNEIVVDAEFVDAETIRCKTPNYEQFGAMPVDVRVAINGEGWTVNKIRYSYFANTAAYNCLAFGPGLLQKGLFGVQISFLVQARDTLNDRRVSGGDHFTVRVVSTDGKYEGLAQITDLQDGQYEVSYCVPMPGSYQVHICHYKLGGSELVPIRGSPFTVHCTDPWVKHRVLGATPGKRKGATLVALQDELVLYGGDNTGVSVCNINAADWKWNSVTTSGDVPGHRGNHSAVVVRDQMVVFGGSSLADSSELADMYWLKKQLNGSWTWGCPNTHTPYVR